MKKIQRETVSLSQIAALKEAVDMAEAWRGGTDPDSWDEFDEGIAEMREALKQVRKDREALRAWRRRNA